MNNMVRIVIKDFKHMAGYNCQLSRMRKVLAHGGIELSEPMILGFCSGLGFFLLLHEANAFSNDVRVGREKNGSI